MANGLVTVVATDSQFMPVIAFPSDLYLEMFYVISIVCKIMNILKWQLIHDRTVNKQDTI